MKNLFILLSLILLTSSFSKANDGTFCPPPNINFTPVNQPVYSNEVSFSLPFFDFATYGDGSFLWNFGDGTTSTEAEPTHLYASGDYIISLSYSNECTSTFTDGQITALGNDYFITTWKTNNPGTSDSTSITIPTHSNYTYDYDVDWNNDGVFDQFNITGNVTHDYGAAGTYQIVIKGDFPAIYFNNTGDKDKILSIDQWGNNQWESMESSFRGCENLICHSIASPDLSSVTSLSSMFNGAHSFTGNLNNWDVSTITNMERMFRYTDFFNGEIGDWDVSNVTNMRSMFLISNVFNQDIGNWNVANVTDMSAMFSQASSFNQDIGNWNVANVTNMNAMFSYTDVFNQDIGNWNVANVTDMSTMFSFAKAFNQDIGNWDVANVTTTEHMFSNSNFAVFNQDIGNWNVANVTNMSDMFWGAYSFNQDIGNWNVANVTNMSYMFRGASTFNQDIGNWDVANVTNMSYMFNYALAFNQDIGNWNVANVTNMSYMFSRASAFNQDIGNWDVSSVTEMNEMFNYSDISQFHYENILTAWSALSLQPNVELGAAGLNYCTSVNERNILINTHGWNITGDSELCPCNIPVADFYPGDETYEGFDVYFSNISTSDTGGSFLWDFGDGNTSTDEFPIHTYAAEGIYTVCLTITDACGTDTNCKTLTITESSCNMPVADFYPGNETYEGLQVNFSNISTSDTGGSFLWDFGDGNTATDEFPIHTYAAEGTYTVCLTITDACGTDTNCKTLTITESSCNMPVADFYPGNETYEGFEVYFSNLSTSDTGGSLLWDFGDGNTSTDEFPIHTYAAEGIYTVCLTITDACGTDTVCKTLTITTPCVPLAPENHGTSPISNTTTQVYWDEVPGATYYQVKYKLLGETTWLTRGTASLQRNLPNLLSDKYYQYKIRSQCSNKAWSDFTDVEIFYTNTCQAPTGVASIYLDETRVRIRWDINPLFEKNRVRYREVGTSVWTVQGNTPGNNYIYINGLTANTTYEYRAKGRCTGDNWSAYSDLLTFSTDIPVSKIAQENIESSLAIFPNPVSDLLNIQYESSSSGSMQITITDIIGKTIYSQNQDCEKGMNKQEINVNHLGKGYYIINIQNGKDIQSMKFIKK